MFGSDIDTSTIDACHNHLSTIATWISPQNCHGCLSKPVSVHRLASDGCSCLFEESLPANTIFLFLWRPVELDVLDPTELKQSLNFALLQPVGTSADDRRGCRNPTIKNGG